MYGCVGIMCCEFGPLLDDICIVIVIGCAVRCGCYYVCIYIMIVCWCDIIVYMYCVVC